MPSMRNRVCFGIGVEYARGGSSGSTTGATAAIGDNTVTVEPAPSMGVVPLDEAGESSITVPVGATQVAACRTSSMGSLGPRTNPIVASSIRADRR